MPLPLLPLAVTGLTLVGLARLRRSSATCDGMSAEEQSFTYTLLAGHDNAEIRRRFVGMSDLQITAQFYKLSAKADALGCKSVAERLRARALEFGRD